MDFVTFTAAVSIHTCADVAIKFGVVGYCGGLRSGSTARDGLLKQQQWMHAATVTYFIQGSDNMLRERTT
jgi:hypothetical protein